MYMKRFSTTNILWRLKDFYSGFNETKNKTKQGEKENEENNAESNGLHEQERKGNQTDRKRTVCDRYTGRLSVIYEEMD